MVQKVGVDAGGSLVKIAYKESSRFHYKIYPIEEFDKVINWLNIFNSDTIIHLTGGKSHLIKEKISQESVLIDEFEAMTMGAKILLDESKKSLDTSFILASIGTGTSIYYVQNGNYERLLGIGIGGGTFIGLGSIISGTTSFHKLVELAAQGHKDKVDLLVKDIYAPGPAPLLGELTAANFGKAHRNYTNKSDQLASLVQLISETIILLISQAAANKQTNTVVLAGSTLDGNAPLKAAFSSFQNMLGMNLIFLENGSFAGARGALGI